MFILKDYYEQKIDIADNKIDLYIISKAIEIEHDKGNFNERDYRYIKYYLNNKTF